MTDIRTATPHDAVCICTIHNHYVSTTTISFEESPVTEGEMAGRILEVTGGGLT